jgi:hydroxymethylbilane synthase
LLKKLLNHPETEECLRAERAFLHTMEGGCNIPVFVLARLIGRRLQIGGGVVSLDGKRMIRKQIEDTAGDPEISGRQLAELVLSDGGSEILFEIKDLLS